MALEIPLRKSNLVQKNTSFLETSIWNKFSKDLKITLNNTTLFTHIYRNLVSKSLSEKNKISVIIFYHYYD